MAVTLDALQKTAELITKTDVLTETAEGRATLESVTSVLRGNLHPLLADEAGEIQGTYNTLPPASQKIVLEFMQLALAAATAAHVKTLDKPRSTMSQPLAELFDKFNRAASPFDKDANASKSDRLRPLLIRFEAMGIHSQGIELFPRLEKSPFEGLESVSVDTSNNTFRYSVPAPFEVKWGLFTTGVSIDELVKGAGANDVNGELALLSPAVRAGKTSALMIETNNPDDPVIYLVPVPRSPGDSKITMMMICTKVSVASLDPTTGDFLGGGALEKPVVYFYPEQPTSLEVTVDVDGEFTAQYPRAVEGNNGWRFLAHPDGTLRDPVGNRAFPYLFWEAKPTTRPTINLEQAHCVARQDSEAFLEKVAAAYAFNDRERTDFISYWIARLERHPFCLVQLLSADAYDRYAKMTVSPTPDTVNRLFMVIKGVAETMPVGAPALPSLTRRGFTVVEWGGAEI